MKLWIARPLMMAALVFAVVGVVVFRYGDIVRGPMSDAPPPGATPRSVPNFIIGDDSRRRVTDTTQFPWRAIAYLELHDRQGRRSRCTGTFIGPDAVLTAAHCLWSNEDGWKARVRVVPGRDGSSEPFGSEWAEGWWVPDAWIEDDEPPFRDWGILALPSRTLGNRVGWMEVAALSSAALTASDFQPGVVGYHGDVSPHGSLWGHFADSFSAVQDLALFYEIDTTGGSSGSAIFSADSTSPFHRKIVGIHAYSLPIDEGQGLNYGRRVTQAVIDDLRAGCRELGCTIGQTAGDDARPTPTVTADGSRLTIAAFCTHMPSENLTQDECDRRSSRLDMGHSRWKVWAGDVVDFDDVMYRFDMGTIFRRANVWDALRALGAGCHELQIAEAGISTHWSTPYEVCIAIVRPTPTPAPTPPPTPVPTVTATPPPTRTTPSIPAVPTGVRVTRIDIPFAPDDNRVRWNAVRGASWYEVWYAAAGEIWMPKATVTATTYLDESASTGTDSYRIRACNSAGCSSYSAIAIDD